MAAHFFKELGFDGFIHPLCIALHIMQECHHFIHIAAHSPNSSKPLLTCLLIDKLTYQDAVLIGDYLPALRLLCNRAWLPHDEKEHNKRKTVKCHFTSLATVNHKHLAILVAALESN